MSYLPMADVLTFILSVCKSLRHLMDVPALWAHVEIEPGNHAFDGRRFVRLLRAIPASSVRFLALDTSWCEVSILGEVVDTILRRKQFELSSLHLSGKKLTSTSVGNVVRRLWAENITTFSLTDVVSSRIDLDGFVRTSLPLMVGITKLRLEGGQWRTQLLGGLSCATSRSTTHGHRAVSDNRLTHLSLVGKNTGVYWDDLVSFGELFPELEELFISYLLADDMQWFKNYGNRSVSDHASSPLPSPTTQTSGSSHKYATVAVLRDAYGNSIEWTRMTRLRYFGCDGIGEPSAKRGVKAFEDVHSAYIWGFLGHHAGALARVELNRGPEVLKYERGHRTREFFIPPAQTHARPSPER
jgi:hypothetical protein